MKLELLKFDLRVTDNAPAARAKAKTPVSPRGARAIADAVQREAGPQRTRSVKAGKQTAALANSLSAAMSEHQPIAAARYRDIASRSFSSSMPQFDGTHALPEGSSYFWGQSKEERLVSAMPNDVKIELNVPSLAEFTKSAKSVEVGRKLHTRSFAGHPGENGGHPWTDWRTDVVATLSVALPQSPEAVAARRLFAAALANRKQPLQVGLAQAAKELLDGRPLNGATLDAVTTLNAFLETHAAFFEPYARLGGSALATVIHMAYRAELETRIAQYMKRVDVSALARFVSPTREFGAATTSWMSGERIMLEKLIRGCVSDPHGYPSRIDESMAPHPSQARAGQQKRAAVSLAAAVADLMPKSPS